MATIAFSCGHCKRPSFGNNSLVSERRIYEEDGHFGRSEFEVALTCASCSRISVLYYRFYDETFEDNEIKNFRYELEESGGAITLRPDDQHPALARPTPAGAPFKIYRAWREAEIAYSTNQLPTVATIAYRRVLEAAANLIDKNGDQKRQPLGTRLKRLQETGVISSELLILTQRALVFGNAAAHEPEPLTDADATVARDLAEAFLRQAYTVPKLLSDAERALEKRKPSTVARASDDNLDQ